MIDRLGFLKEILNRDPHLGKLLENIFDGFDGLSNQLGVNPHGKVQPPDQLKAINVKTGTDHVHVTLHDPSAGRKGVQYFVEFSTDKSFPGGKTHLEDLGTSRGRVIPLPAKDDSGNPVTYYARAYHQLPGSDPSKPVVFGGKATPIAITLTGSSKLTLLPAQGSGTAPADGSRPGYGLGKDIRRTVPGPKVPVPPRAV